MRHRTVRLGLLSACLAVAAAMAPATTQAGPRSPRPSATASTATDLDACPATPKKAVPLVAGCSALQLIHDPGPFFGPAIQELGAAADSLQPSASLAPALGLVSEGSDLLAESARLLGRGKPCPSADAAAAAVDRLAGARASIGITIETAQAELIETRDPDARGTDVNQLELRIAGLFLHQALVEGASGPAEEAAEAARAVCEAIAKKVWKGTGTVKRTEDAGGWFRLGRKNRIVGLAAKRYPHGIVDGLEVRARGMRFEDGSVLARGVTDLSAKDPGPKPKKKKKPGCLPLRIVPVQPMFPQSSGPYTLHPTDGYEATDGTLYLERMMRLAVVQTNAAPCPRSLGNGKPVFYEMQIDVQQGFVTSTIAFDLREGDTPIPFPGWLSPVMPVTITATAFRVQCINLGPNVQTCLTPQKLNTRTYTAVIQPLASYVEAKYSTTVFSVTDDGVPGDFEPATVTGVQLTSSSFLGASFHPSEYFKAEGYRIVNGQSSRPQIHTILHSQPFAVYEDDFFDPQLLFTESQMAETGQIRPSGLRWARIEGTRNGKPFWYAATPPSLVRDRVHVCQESPAFTLPVGDLRPTPDPNYGPTWPPAAPYNVVAVKDSFYKLPFNQDFWPGTGLMNIDDPNHPPRHPEWQAYAFDLGATEGEDLLAARGGTVIALEESDPYNVNDPNKPENWPGIGNWMWILHEDGTIGVYFHMQVNSLVPTIGDHVSRGDLIAKIGNTGNSSGPHVHFEAVGPVDTNTKARIRFEAKRPSPTGGQFIDPCYIPRSGEEFRSTNA